MFSFVIIALVSTAIATNGSKECAQKCTAKWEACKTTPNANQSFCDSEYTSCLGFSPFSNGYTKPTACSSSTAEPTTTVCFDCSAPPAEPTTTVCFDCSPPPAEPTTTVCFDCSPPPAEPTTTVCFDCSPPPAEPTTTVCFDCSPPLPQPTQDACARKCTDQWVACKTTPNTNQSLCGAQYASCLGFAPFKDGSGMPTACITTTTSFAAPTSKPTATICYDCMGGHNNGTVPNPRPPFTGAAGHIQPAMLVALLGAAALL